MLVADAHESFQCSLDVVYEALGAIGRGMSSCPGSIRSRSVEIPARIPSPLIAGGHGDNITPEPSRNPRFPRVPAFLPFRHHS